MSVCKYVRGSVNTIHLFCVILAILFFISLILLLTSTFFLFVVNFSFFKVWLFNFFVPIWIFCFYGKIKLTYLLTYFSKMGRRIFAFWHPAINQRGSCETGIFNMSVCQYVRESLNTFSQRWVGGFF